MLVNYIVDLNGASRLRLLRNGTAFSLFCLGEYDFHELAYNVLFS